MNTKFEKALTATDFYKVGHIAQYPEGTEFIYSNFTPRSNNHNNLPALNDGHDNEVVFFGLQGFIIQYILGMWEDTFFKLPKEEVVKHYKRIVGGGLGVGNISLAHIEELHDLGHLPIFIKALPEGARVPAGVPVLTITNTDIRFAWVVNYLETLMSSCLWKSTTSATTASWYKRIMLTYANKTGGPIDFVQWQGHDFSFRGMSGYYDAASSGAGHLLSFYGTDNIPAMDYLDAYYEGGAVEILGSSVPATEHSVMCMGTQENEIDTFKRLLTEVYPTGIVSIVSDTWDFWKVISEASIALKDIIMGREGKIVFRPDSGNPVDILCGTADVFYMSDFSSFHDAQERMCELLLDKVGDETAHGECGDDSSTGYFSWQNKVYKMTLDFEWSRQDRQYYYIYGYSIASCEPVTLTPEQKGAVEVLWDIFGGTVTDKAYKVLDSHVGLIYGDSITPERCSDIFRKLEQKGFASCNVVFGIGSYTYQYVTRDTHGFAMKATYGIVNNEPRELFKQPKTDSGKTSAKGLLQVKLDENGKYVLRDQVTVEEEEYQELQEVFCNGKFTNMQTLQDIRNRIDAK